MAKSLIGIEMSSIEVCITRSNGKVVHEKMPATLFGSNGVSSPEALADFLKQVKKQHRISGSDCAFILPSSATYFITTDTPVMSEKELKLNVPYEFKDYIGVDTGKYNYDYVVDRVNENVSGDPESLHLYAAAGDKEVIAEYEKAFKMAGLKLKSALPYEMCAIKLMKDIANEGKEYCLIGVGYNETRIYIFKGSELMASKVIDLGCINIDAVIADKALTDVYRAATLRNANRDNIQASSFLTPVYDKISLEVVKTINFYKYQHSDSLLDTAYFFGYGSNNDTLVNNICKSIEFRKGNILDILPDQFNDGRALMGIGLIL